MVKQKLVAVSFYPFPIGASPVVQLYDSKTKTGIEIVDHNTHIRHKSLRFRMISFQHITDVGVHNEYKKINITPKMESGIERACETDAFEYEIDPEDEIPYSPKMAHKSTYKINLPEGALESLLAKAAKFEKHSEIIQNFSYLENALSSIEDNLRYFKPKKERISSSIFPLKNFFTDLKPVYDNSIEQSKEIDQFFQKFQTALPLCVSNVKEDSDKGYSIIKELFK